MWALLCSRSGRLQAFEESIGDLTQPFVVGDKTNVVTLGTSHASHKFLF